MEYLSNVRTFKSFEEIAADYESGELHPGDLKKGLTNALNKILQVSKNLFLLQLQESLILANT